jgi:hypothetical protein
MCLPPSSIGLRTRGGRTKIRPSHPWQIMGWGQTQRNQMIIPNPIRNRINLANPTGLWEARTLEQSIHMDALQQFHVCLGYSLASALALMRQFGTENRRWRKIPRNIPLAPKLQVGYPQVTCISIHENVHTYWHYPLCTINYSSQLHPLSACLN